MTAEYVWIRLGDVAEYEKFNTPYDAGLAVGERIGIGKPEPLAFHYRAAGVAIPPAFVGNNYISLFWGDENAQWTRDLTNVEKRHFEEGVGEGILGHSSKKLSRDDVRVEVWEERDRLHIGIQNKETGDYLKSWWDDDAREMFEQGFFKSGPKLKESVLEYAEDMGILEK